MSHFKVCILIFAQRADKEVGMFGLKSLVAVQPAVHQICRCFHSFFVYHKIDEIFPRSANSIAQPPLGPAAATIIWGDIASVRSSIFQKRKKYTSLDLA